MVLSGLDFAVKEYKVIFIWWVLISLKLAAYAAQRKQTPETLFQEWVRAVTRSLDKPLSSSGIKPIGKEGQAEPKGELLSGPLFQVAGLFAIGEPGWADKQE